MAREQLKTLSEPMYYLLLAVIQPRHGYGIMQCIAQMTEERVQVGAGTLYALLSRFEAEGIIAQIMERERKKIYQITPKGAELLAEEYSRLNRMVEDGRRFFDGSGTLLPIDYQEIEVPQIQEAEEAPRESAKREEAPQPEPQPQRGGGKKRGGLRKGIFAT